MVTGIPQPETIEEMKRKVDDGIKQGIAKNQKVAKKSCAPAPKTEKKITKKAATKKPAKKTVTKKIAKGAKPTKTTTTKKKAGKA